MLIDVISCLDVQVVEGWKKKKSNQKFMAILYLTDKAIMNQLNKQFNKNIQIQKLKQAMKVINQLLMELLKPKIYQFQVDEDDQPKIQEQKSKEIINMESFDNLPELPQNDIAYEFLIVNGKKGGKISDNKIRDEKNSLLRVQNQFKKIKEYQITKSSNVKKQKINQLKNAKIQEDYIISLIEKKNSSKKYKEIISQKLIEKIENKKKESKMKENIYQKLVQQNEQEYKDQTSFIDYGKDYQKTVQQLLLLNKDKKVQKQQIEQEPQIELFQFEFQDIPNLLSCNQQQYNKEIESVITESNQSEEEIECSFEIGLPCPSTNQQNLENQIKKTQNEKPFNSIESNIEFPSFLTEIQIEKNVKKQVNEDLFFIFQNIEQNNSIPQQEENKKIETYKQDENVTNILALKNTIIEVKKVNQYFQEKNCSKQLTINNISSISFFLGEKEFENLLWNHSLLKLYYPNEQTLFLRLFHQKQKFPQNLYYFFLHIPLQHLMQLIFHFVNHSYYLLKVLQLLLEHFRQQNQAIYSLIKKIFHL